MKKDFRKIYWAIAIIWGVLASLTTLAYAMFGESSAESFLWDVSYWSAVLLVAIIVLAALGFALTQIIRGLIENPKKQMGVIIGFGALVLVFLVSFLLSSGTDVPESVFEKTGASYGSSKLIGALLYMVYALAGGVVIAAVYSEIAKKLK